MGCQGNLRQAAPKWALCPSRLNTSLVIFLVVATLHRATTSLEDMLDESDQNLAARTRSRQDAQVNHHSNHDKHHAPHLEHRRHHHRHHHHHHHHHHNCQDRALASNSSDLSDEFGAKDYKNASEILRSVKSHHQNYSKHSSNNQHHHHHRRRHLKSSPDKHASGHSASLRISRRQVIDEAIQRLRILESQDGQLRAFAEGAELAARKQQLQLQLQLEHEHERRVHEGDQDFHCHLRLMTNELVEQNGARTRKKQNHKVQAQREEAAPEWQESQSCLRNRELARQIPPFMLNLYRQLALDLQQANLNFSETVQMMPYKAQIMRSFRQPKLELSGGSGDLMGRALAGQPQPRWQEDNNENEPEDDKRPHWPPDSRTLETPSRPHSSHVPSRTNVVVELSVLNADDNQELPEEQPASSRRNSTTQHQTNPACDFKQRLLPAHKRAEICFWFKLDESLASLIDTSTAATPHSLEAAESVPSTSESGRERLVEAELHVFKLFPLALAEASNGRPSDMKPPVRRAQTATSRPDGASNNKSVKFGYSRSRQQFEPTNRTTAGNLYHLKTNLLEVSLYQVLPRRRLSSTSTSSDQQVGGSPKAGEADEFPLRLLDIRRIDLNSNGWETFYVKRAVEDWLREPRLNLGLVIKAKSMFDEPIRIGLIRFADAYDDQQMAEEETHQESGGNSATSTTNTSKRDFSLTHQPLLVIYTTRGAKTSEAAETSPWLS